MREGEMRSDECGGMRRGPMLNAEGDPAPRDIRSDNGFEFTAMML
jgi:hypothetical protein